MEKQIVRKYSVVICTSVSQNWSTQQKEGTYYRVTPETHAALVAANIMRDQEIDWDALKETAALQAEEVEVEGCRYSEVTSLGWAMWDFM